jgi:hypothetical protein
MKGLGLLGMGAYWQLTWVRMSIVGNGIRLLGI